MEKARFSGLLTLSKLPPHHGIILNLCLYAVEGPESPAPYCGEPPSDAATDIHKLFEKVDLERSSRHQTFERPFVLWHEPGWYFVEVRAILFRKEGGKVFAQAEQFFFARRPVRIEATASERITFPMSWPDTPLNDLPRYGSISPS